MLRTDPPSSSPNPQKEVKPPHPMTHPPLRCHTELCPQRAAVLAWHPKSFPVSLPPRCRQAHMCFQSVISLPGLLTTPLCGATDGRAASIRDPLSTRRSSPLPCVTKHLPPTRKTRTSNLPNVLATRSLCEVGPHKAFQGHPATICLPSQTQKCKAMPFPPPPSSACGCARAGQQGPPAPGGARGAGTCWRSSRRSHPPTTCPINRRALARAPSAG